MLLNKLTIWLNLWTDDLTLGDRELMVGMVKTLAATLKTKTEDRKTRR